MGGGEEYQKNVVRLSEIQIRGENNRSKQNRTAIKTDVIKRQTTDEMRMEGGREGRKFTKGSKKWNNQRQQRVPELLVDMRLNISKW